MGDEADVPAHRRGLIRQLEPTQDDPSRGRARERRQDPQQGRLTGPVGAKDCHPLIPRNAQVEAVQSSAHPVATDQPTNLYGPAGRRRRGPLDRRHHQLTSAGLGRAPDRRSSSISSRLVRSRSV